MPFSTITGAAKVASDIVRHENPRRIVKDAVPLVEFAGNLIAPGAGFIAGAVVYLMASGRPMTQQETNAWMDRMGIGTQS